MFNFCTKLKSLDLSNFDTEGTNTYKMFHFCSLQKENIKINNKEDKINKMRKKKNCDSINTINYIFI